MKLPIGDIKENEANPRFIKDDKFKNLVKSIKEFPEMAEVREVVLNKDHVILGGNMRFKAMKAAGWKEIPVRIVDWPEDKQKEFIIKDNVSEGDWDWSTLANEWDKAQLDDWGVTSDFESNFQPNTEPEANFSQISEADIEKKAKEMAQKYIDMHKKNLEVTCPECAATFSVSN